MNHDPAVDALLKAYAGNDDPHLLATALDIATADADKRCIIDAALAAPGLPDDLRRRMAEAALTLGDMKIAIALCQDQADLIDVQVEAMIAIGEIVEAEALYLRLVADHPVRESADISEMISKAKETTAATEPSGSNVIGFAAARRGLRSDARLQEDEEKASRALFGTPLSTIRFDDVGGLDAVKQHIIRRIVTPFKKPSLFARYRRKAGGGVLLYGPPGCGKTLLARATAGECGARFVNVPVVDVVDKYIGEAERKLAAIFADARRDTPTVLFFDELEALAGSRSGQANQSHISLVSTFLAEMDGFADNNDGVLILAATNMPWGVDAAFRRPGRFDRVQFVPPPDKPARLRILELQLEGRPVEDGLDLAAIAAATSGYSGADLANLVNGAVDLAIEESIDSNVEQPISRRHLAEAREDVRPTTVEWLTTARNYAKYSNAGGQYDEVAAFLKANGL